MVETGGSPTLAAHLDNKPGGQDDASVSVHGNCHLLVSGSCPTVLLTSPPHQVPCSVSVHVWSEMLYSTVPL